MKCLNFSKTLLLICFLTLSIPKSVFAFCWGSGCLYFVPLYDQRSTTIPSSWFPNGNAANSQLCAPTSGAMAMQGLLQDLNSDHVKAAGWLQSNIAGRPMAQQIVDTAKLMGTDPAKGTGQGNSVGGFAGRTSDYVFNLTGFPFPALPVTHATEKFGSQINLAAFQSVFQSGVTGMITSYGHYTRITTLLSTPTLKQESISYSRNGGHVLAPRGYLANLVVFNDPEGGVLQFSELMGLTAKNNSLVNHGVKQVVMETLPNSQPNASVYQVYQGGTYYPIIEAMTALTALFKS